MYKLSRQAERDIEQIYQYSIAQFGVTQASDYLNELERAFELLAEFPRMGRSAEIMRPNLRCHQHQSHIIYYKPIANGISVVRVLHKRRDYKRLM